MSRDAIADLVHRYSDAVVRRDAEQWSGTWAPDAVWDLGRGRRVEGHEAIADLWTAAMTRFRAVLQTVLNGSVEIDESEGTGSGRWYIQEALHGSDGTNDIMIGHYDDTYVRIDGRWRFSSRVLTPHYQGPPDLSGTFSAAEET